MIIYMIVPDCTCVSGFIAKVGWRVFTSLPSALSDLEERIRSKQRSRASESRMPFDPTAIYAEIPIEGVFSDEWCDCTVGDHCGHNPYLLIDRVNVDQPHLKKPVKNWRRVTVEDYMAWEIEAKMMGTQIPWRFKDRWHALFPSSEFRVRPVIMHR